MGSHCTGYLENRFLSFIIILFIKTVSHHFYHCRFLSLHFYHCRSSMIYFLSAKRWELEKRFGATGDVGRRAKCPWTGLRRALAGRSLRKGHLWCLPSQSGLRRLLIAHTWGHLTIISRQWHEAVGKCPHLLRLLCQTGLFWELCETNLLGAHTAPPPSPAPLHLLNTDTSRDTGGFGLPLTRTMECSSFHSTKTATFGWWNLAGQCDSAPVNGGNLALRSWCPGRQSHPFPLPGLACPGPSPLPPAWSPFIIPSSLSLSGIPPQRRGLVWQMSCQRSEMVGGWWSPWEITWSWITFYKHYLMLENNSKE